MKYMVMECRPSYAILLDEEGCFKKAANLHYEVGQIVEDPVLMRDRAAAPGGFSAWVRGGGCRSGGLSRTVFWGRLLSELYAAQLLYSYGH